MAYYPFSKKTRDEFGIVLTSPYGMRNGKMHKGADYAPSKNKNGDIEIIANVDGDLITGKDQYGGLWSYVKGVDGRGYLTVHHKRFFKTLGKVKAGEVIALMGESGLATGVHTHFEIRQNAFAPSSHINPEKQNLTYYEPSMEESELDLAKKKIDLIDEKYGIRLMKTIDESKPTREEIALIITRVWDAIDKKYKS